MTDNATAGVITRWYAGAARDLPWRRPDRSAWGVLASEGMLQQTPGSRVLPVWHDWMTRWPSPAALAEDGAGDAVRAWGRLGYPRRALRLHACAVAIRDTHGGAVPSTYEELRALPGVGDYTAAAVAAFAYGAAVAVLDTNVRRVYARLVDGTADAATASPTAGEGREAATLLPGGRPAGYSVPVMELGPLVSTARTPRCTACPVAGNCLW